MLLAPCSAVEERAALAGGSSSQQQRAAHSSPPNGSQAARRTAAAGSNCRKQPAPQPPNTVLVAIIYIRNIALCWALLCPGQDFSRSQLRDLWEHHFLQGEEDKIKTTVIICVLCNRRSSLEKQGRLHL